MKLDAAQLTAFAAVIEEGSFDAAARRLHITPSAVSQRIKTLETRMGQVLVRRTRPARPTETGEVLVRLAGQIALLESEALTAVGSDRAHQHASFRLPIAVNADSLATWFLPSLATLPAEHAVSFDIHQEDEDHSATLLRDGSVMAAVTADPRAVQGCRVERLGSMRYRALASPGYRDRYLTEGASPDTLASAPMLVYNRKDRLQERFLRMVTEKKLDPPVTFLPSSWGFVEAARLGLGWGMVPEQMGQSDLDEGRLIELAPGHHLDVPLYWQRWRLDSPILHALTEVIMITASTRLR